MSSKKRAQEKKGHFIACRVDQTTQQQLDARAKELGVPIAQLVRWAVNDWLKKTGTNHRGA